MSLLVYGLEQLDIGLSHESLSSWSANLLHGKYTYVTRDLCENIMFVDTHKVYTCIYTLSV